MREEDIRPEALLAEYLRLSADDAARLLAGGGRLDQRSCPACTGTRHGEGFEKNGFRLTRCAECDTLYAIDCLDEAGLGALYGDSPSAHYWATVFMPAVLEARRVNIFRPRVRQVLELAAAHGLGLAEAIDVGAGNGIFLEEGRAEAPGLRWRGVEPGAEAAGVCKALGFETFTGFAAEAAVAPGWAGSADLVTSFEVIEHVPDPAHFLGEMAALARPGGLILATGLCGSGFDIVSLGARSKAVAPPHHVNFLSRRGVSLLLDRAGLDEVAFLTPGRLDVELVAKAEAAEPGLIADPFLRRLLTDGDEGQRAGFQAFLAEAGLSSHMWILARRRA